MRILHTKRLFTSLVLVGLFSQLAFSQGAAKRFFPKKSFKMDVGGLAISDIPLASRYGVAYELMLDHNYGLQIGLAYLGTPSYALGKDSTKAMWRVRNKIYGIGCDVAFKHYFDDIDETTTYMSTFFSFSQVWLASQELSQDYQLRKIRVGIQFGYQKEFKNMYFDINWGLGVRFKNYRFDLQHLLPNDRTLRPENDYWGLGWKLNFNQNKTSLAMPIQFTVGVRY